MNVVLNGDILPEGSVSIPDEDRAFRYGDGIFETIRYEKSNVYFWPDHYDRLTRGMQALSLRFSGVLDSDSLLVQIRQLLIQNQLTTVSARIKIQVWRQTGGFYTPTQNEAHYLITTYPDKPFTLTEKTKVKIFEDYRLSPSPVSAFKTLNALPYILAGIANQKARTDDLILVDTAGNLAECIASNLFWLRNQTLFTPSLHTGCVEGVLRRQLIKLAVLSGLQVIEGLFQPKSLLGADLVFCGNVAGIQWIRQVEEMSFNTARTTLKPLRLLVDSLNHLLI